MRILYVLNHQTAMKFEVDQLLDLGFEVFVPKILPKDGIAFRSARVSYEYDKNLSIDAAYLEILNNCNFYDEIDAIDFNMLNDLFEIVILISYGPIIEKFIQNFQGIIIVRLYGDNNNFRYSKALNSSFKLPLERLLNKAGSRLFFAPIFDQISFVEETWIKDRSFTLPLGIPSLNEEKLSKKWVGNGDYIVFLAPDILSISYYKDVYYNVKKIISNEFAYKVIGKQFIMPYDQSVLGYVDDENFNLIMSSAICFLYPSKEKRHLHYSPVEAMKNGVPVIFDNNGALSSLFSTKAPGSYNTHEECRSLIRRLSRRERKLTKSILDSQNYIIDRMSPEWSKKYWRNFFKDKIAPKIIELESNITSHKKLQQLPIEAGLFKWLHSTTLDGVVNIVGNVPVSKIEERSRAFYDDIDLNDKSILDIGEGEGGYSIYALRKMSRHVHTVAITHDQFNCLEILKSKSYLEGWTVQHCDLANLISIITLSTRPNQYDYILLHGILNFYSDPMYLIRSAIDSARKGVIIEFFNGDLNCQNGLLQLSTDEQLMSGYPPLSFNLSFLLLSLKNYNSISISYKATPGYENSRTICRIDKLSHVDKPFNQQSSQRD